MGVAIGVDVGGTGVRAAVVAEDGTIGELVRCALQDRTVASVVDAIASLGQELEASTVGIGVPGFVAEGVVLGSPNFPDWQDTDLAGLVADRTGLSVHVENDANCAAWGVWVVDRQRQGDLVVLTLGTGVGGGVILQGRLLRGRRGTAAELGHIHVGGQIECACGSVGCLETWAGTGGLVARSAGRATDGQAVMAAASAGEGWAIAVRDEAADGLSRGVASLVNVFAPDCVAFCGGLAQLGEHVRLQRVRPVDANARALTLRVLGRADSYAIVGAADLARRH